MKRITYLLLIISILLIITGCPELDPPDKPTPGPTAAPSPDSTAESTPDTSPDSTPGPTLEPTLEPTPDLSIPEVLSFNYADNHSVYLYNNLVLEFSTTMNQTTTENAFALSPSVAGVFTWNAESTILTFNPDNNLPENTQFTLSLDTTATSLAGISPDNVYSSNFTTVVTFYNRPQITGDSGIAYYVSLVWTGTEYGVAWEDQRDGNREIYFSRLDSNGNRIGTADTRITNDPADSRKPDLVWTGNEFVVCWYDNRIQNGEIFLARIDATGDKIGNDIQISDALYVSDYPSLVWTGTELGVAWSDARDFGIMREIYFARIDSTGSKIGSDLRVTSDSDDSHFPSLTWGNNEYGLTWGDNINGGLQSEIYFARIDSTGSKIGDNIRITDDPDDCLFPSIVWTGTEYAIAWEDHRNSSSIEIYFCRIDSTGIKLSGDIRITNSYDDSQNPCLVWTGSEYGLSWHEPRNKFSAGDPEIYFTHINSAGSKIGDDVRVTSDTQGSAFSSLLWNGNDYIISYDCEVGVSGYEIFIAY